MTTRYPNRAQTPAIAARNGRKGRAKSPWNNYPIVASAENRERLEGWKR